MSNTTAVLERSLQTATDLYPITNKIAKTETFLTTTSLNRLRFSEKAINISHDKLYDTSHCKIIHCM